MAALKLAETVVLTAIAVAVLAGRTDATPDTEVPVVNVQTLAAAKATPAALLTPVVRVAVYSVLAARLPVGVKVALVVLGLVTTPTTVTAGVPVVRVKVDVVRVVGSMATLKVADRALLIATAVAPEAGTTAVTVGVTTTTAAGELELVGEEHPTKATAARIRAGKKSRKERMVLPLDRDNTAV
jgi:hypothetical protein